jgi:hypothetical protein
MPNKKLNVEISTFVAKEFPPNFPKLREHQEIPLKSRRNPSPSTIKKTWKN